jgi:hypothetical protein
MTARPSLLPSHLPSARTLVERAWFMASRWSARWTNDLDALGRGYSAYPGRWQVGWELPYPFHDEAQVVEGVGPPKAECPPGSLRHAFDRRPSHVEACCSQTA